MPKRFKATRIVRPKKRMRRNAERVTRSAPQQLQPIKVRKKMNQGRRILGPALPLSNRQWFEAQYAQNRRRQDDSINEHLPTLRQLASECDTVCEFGVKIARSSIALLLGVKDVLYSWDIQPTPQAVEAAEKAGKKWVYTIGDSCKSNVQPCDMLFIDSLHTYDQLTAELEHAAHFARKYLVFHDTVTFGESDAIGETGRKKEGTKGIMPAIRELMQRDPTWRVKHHYTNNNGLLVLERDLNQCLMVFTALYGDHEDVLLPPKVYNPYVRYVVFSDRIQNVPVWETVVTPVKQPSPRRQARWIKAQGYREYFPEHGFSLWVDAGMLILHDPVRAGKEIFRDGAELAAMRHPDRDNIRAEAGEIKRLCPDVDVERLKEQVRRYTKNVLKDQTELTTTGFLWRRHTERVCERFNPMWWKEIEQYTERDQISVDYAIAKSRVDRIFLPGDYRNNAYVKFIKWTPVQRRQYLAGTFDVEAGP
jgi:hypothetical protein